GNGNTSAAPRDPGEGESRGAASLFVRNDEKPEARSQTPEVRERSSGFWLLASSRWLRYSWAYDSHNEARGARGRLWPPRRDLDRQGSAEDHAPLPGVHRGVAL